jgi:N-hydroxyarylamine O-acetyltransferase
MTEDEFAAYLRRIRHPGPVAADRATLGALIHAHAQAIPFEALDPIAGRLPSLAPAALAAKLVGRRRGGYCYEQNSLFRNVLAAVGFDVRPLEARVRAGVPDGVVTPRSHMAVEVRLEDGLWLVDVGFAGLAPLVPVPFDGAEAAGPDGGRYRLEARPDGWRLQVAGETGWHDCYHVERTSPTPVDLEAGNWYAATYPDFLLRRRLIVARATGAGRLTLVDRELTERRAAGGAPAPVTLGSPAELGQVLGDVFGLDVDSETVARAAEVALATP